MNKRPEVFGFHEETPVHIRINAHNSHLLKRIVRRNIPHSELIGVPIKAEIWNLEPGVEVLSRCEATGEIGYRKITRVIVHESHQVYELSPEVCRLTYSREGEDEKIFGPGHLAATLNYPVWVIGKGWVKMEDLTIGDEFFTSDGSHSHFIALEKRGSRVPVCSIEVEDFHSYFVGGLSGLWVQSKN